MNLIAIDDPIQNMDEVNRFSICDILSGLKLPLIFSTHDFDFVRLFVKKNEHRQDQIRIYLLEDPKSKKVIEF